MQRDQVCTPSQLTIFEANEEKNELKRSFDETILVTQAVGRKETMQAPKATRTKRRIDKNSGKVFGAIGIF